MNAAQTPGVPRRMAAALAALVIRDGAARHAPKLDLMRQIEADTEALPMTAAPDAIHAAADRACRDCYRLCEVGRTADAILSEIHALCDRAGVNHPQGDTTAEQIARAVDRVWWIRQLRTQHARRFEHLAIRLGFTSLKAGPYLSHESAARQAKRNRDNAKLLASITLENESGQAYTLAELSALGVANKAIRRGELMTRIRGFEEIAGDLGHVGIFATVTCPSKFHSVGGENPNYGGATPRQAQAYLVRVWASIRSALHRRGIHAYGFRIAEPHTDGCPHWHMLLFVAPEHLEAYEATIERYALAEDGAEKGAAENRVKIVRIEAGKGTAAGYIAKYVAKNIDGEAVGDHKTRDGYLIAPDLFEKEEFTPSQRVTYWSQLHGIRQFQQIGGAPVGVWRELRRVKAETVANAPAELRAAWLAVQKIESEDAAVAKRADFAAYTRAQGGAFVGRRALIQIAKRATVIVGRYSTREEGKPCGVYHVAQAGAVYESARYLWTVKESAVAVAVAVPWTRVNNCTRQGKNAPWTDAKNAEFQKNSPAQPVISEPFAEKPMSNLAGPGGQGFPDQYRNYEIYKAHRKNGRALDRAAHLAQLQKKHAAQAARRKKDA